MNPSPSQQYYIAVYKEYELSHIDGPYTRRRAMSIIERCYLNAARTHIKLTQNVDEVSERLFSQYLKTSN